MTQATTDRELIITRTFDAPRELVFSVFKDPERLSMWWGPEGYSAECKHDFRVGGEYLWTVIDQAGNRVPGHGSFTEIDEPNKITIEDRIDLMPEDFKAVIGAQYEEPREIPPSISQSFIFEDIGNGRTQLTVHAVFPTTADRDAMLKLQMNEGWNSSLDKIAAVLASLS